MSLKIWLPLNGNIENQGTLNTTSRLPSGYTEVEYLESTGTQYIDTGVDNNTNSIKLYTTIQVTVPASTNAYALGYYTDNQGQFFLYRAGTVWQWSWRCGYLNSTGAFDTNKHSHMFYVENGTSYYKLDGQIVSQQTTNRNGGRIYIAGNKHGQSTIRTFTAVIDDGNTIKRNFIPCYRNSDNKPGMYDTVTGTFYTNAGSGEFSVGPAVTCSITNNGATFVDGGKIGQKCASFNNTPIQWKMDLSNINNFSAAAWVNFANLNSAQYIFHFGGISSYPCKYALYYNEQYVLIINGSEYNSGITVSANQWNHVTMSYSNGIAKLYINGNNVYSANVNTSFDGSQYCIIGARINNSSATLFKYQITGGGKINDFRIYDKALSADQIKEISRGMVLHYKMCQPERSENLLANGAATEITCRSKNPDYPLKAIRTTLENNTQYTLSFDAKSDNGLGTFYCSLANGGSSQIYFAAKIKPTTKYKHFVYTATRGTQTTNNILFAAYYGWSENANVTDTIHIKNVKLEKGSNPNATFSPPPTETLNWGTIEYDGSGFKNHGTVSGNVTLSADSPRYTGSYSLADGKYITAPGFTYINSGSISFWAKINTIASNGWLPFTGPTTGYYIMASTGGTGSFYHNAAGEGTKTIYEDGKVVTAPSSIGVWHHYVITNVDLTTWTKLMINNYNSNWNANMQMSDIRVYSTVLDATDVAELYKLGK